MFPSAFLSIFLGCITTQAMTIDSLQTIRDQFTSPSHKISINKIPKEWMMTNSSPDENLLAMFRHKENPDLVLSLRVDNLERFPSVNPNLRKYVNYYTKKYPRAGLEVLNEPKKSIFKHYAMLKVSHKDKPTASRQTIMWHPAKKVFIFTCSGNKGNEEKTYQLCDSIISKIQWIQ